MADKIKDKVIKKNFTKDQLDNMPIEDLIALVGEAKAASGKFSGKMVVRQADGKIKYDSKVKKSDFDEVPGYLDE